MVHAYLVNVYSKFHELHRILSYNGTEFKNKLLTQVASTLEIKQVFSSPIILEATDAVRM